MEIKDVLTFIVAAYGAALATYVAVVQRRDKRPRLDVNLSYGFLTFGSTLSDQQLLLTAANIGERPITIASGVIMLPDKTQVISFANNSSAQFPHQLEVGKSMTVWFELRPLVAQLRAKGHKGTIKVRAKFSDQTSREYLSRTTDLELKD